jgi:tetratricopeptide (TPR) repeat protein
MDTSNSMRWLVLTFRLLLVCCTGLLLYYLLVDRPSPLPKELLVAKNSLSHGDEAEARAALDHYLDAHPHDPTAYLEVIGLCENFPHTASDLLLNYAQRAVQDCSNADSTSRSRLYLALADAYTQQKPPKNQEARAAALQGLNLTPDDPQTLNDAGYILAITSNDPDDLKRAQILVANALTKLQHSFDFSSDRSELYAAAEDSYGWVLYRQAVCGPKSQAHNLYADAVEMLLQATSDLPKNTPPVAARTYYYHLAAAYYGLGRYDLAKHAIQVALLYDPNYEEALQEQKIIEAALAKTPSTEEASVGTTTTPQLSTPIPKLTPASLPAQK